MPDIIEDVEDAAAVSNAHDGNRGVGGGIEEILFQSKHLGDVGVEDAAVRENKDALSSVPASDAIDGLHHALAKGFRWLAARNSIPASRSAHPAQDFALAFLQCLAQGVQVLPIGWQWQHFTQANLLQVVDNGGGQAETFGQGRGSLKAAAQGTAVERIE